MVECVSSDKRTTITTTANSENSRNEYKKENVKDEQKKRKTNVKTEK